MGSFSVADYFVFFATIGLSLTIGIFFAIWDRKKNTPLDYFLAARKFRVLPAALSFIVTFQSSLLLLGVPVEVYMYGTVFCYFIVGVTFAYIFAGITIVPVFHSLQLTSVYKYFELRYHDNVLRYMVMTGGVLYTILYMGSVTYGTCVALEVVIGIPFWATVLLFTGITSIYTSIGGIKAVIWTDVFQLIVMVAGIIAVLVKSISDTGGMSTTLKLAATRMNFGEFRIDPTIQYTVWNTSAGSFVMYLYCAYTQAGIQRINTTPDIKSGRWLYIISGPLYGIILFLVSFQGVTIYAYHAAKGCDVIASKRIENVNALLPVTILDLFQNMPGLSGLFVASLSCAVLSTLSSCLNSMSAITYEDIIKVLFPNISDSKATFVSKIVVLMYGLLAMALTFAISRVPGTALAIFISFSGALEGPTCAIFVLSILFRRSTSKGMVIGGFIGMVVTLWISLGKRFSNIPAYPTLPDGPIDKCLDNTTGMFGSNVYSYINNSFTQLPYEYTTNNSYLFTGTLASTIYPSTVNDSSLELSPLQKLYSLSIVMYSLTGMVTSLIVGVVVSLLTKPPEDIDERCLFSFSKHLVMKNKHQFQTSSTDKDKESKEMTPMISNSD